MVKADYEGRTIRFVLHNGRVEVVARDVCDQIGVKNCSNALTNFREGKEKVTVSNGVPITLTKEGLRKLLDRRPGEQADKFRLWAFYTAWPRLEKEAEQQKQTQVQGAGLSPDFVQWVKDEIQQLKNLLMKAQTRKHTVGQYLMKLGLEVPRNYVAGFGQTLASRARNGDMPTGVYKGKPTYPEDVLEAFISDKRLTNPEAFLPQN